MVSISSIRLDSDNIFKVRVFSVNNCVREAQKVLFLVTPPPSLLRLRGHRKFFPYIKNKNKKSIVAHPFSPALLLVARPLTKELFCGFPRRRGKTSLILAIKMNKTFSMMMEDTYIKQCCVSGSGSYLKLNLARTFDRKRDFTIRSSNFQ